MKGKGRGAVGLDGKAVVAVAAGIMGDGGLGAVVEEEGEGIREKAGLECCIIGVVLG